jgi:hypothetical protein
MQTVLFVVGSIIASSGTIPYIIATVQRKTKPRVVTWFTWSLLTSLAAAAAFSDHQFGAGLFALSGAICSGLTVIAGLRYGDRRFDKVDVLCQVGALLGLGLWLVFNNPAFGVWAAIVIDCVGLVPTVRHAWRAPHEETPSTYALVGVGGTITVLPLFVHGPLTTTSIGYPLYAAVSLGVTAVLIVLRRKVVALPQVAQEVIND